jgi:hypothetical protein
MEDRSTRLSRAAWGCFRCARACGVMSIGVSATAVCLLLTSGAGRHPRMAALGLALLLGNGLVYGLLLGLGVLMRRVGLRP